MGDIVKGVLGGGWSLLVGWILPTAVNLLLLWFLVLPGARGWAWVDGVDRLDPQQQALALLVGAVVLGLVLAGAKTPLYRLLEGYLGWHPVPERRRRWLRWPIAATLTAARDRQARHRDVLLARLELVRLVGREERGRLTAEQAARLGALRARADLDRYRERDARRRGVLEGLLEERARRYPVSADQVAPTRLGNAIRRMEEYGYDRYRLDSQRLWYELVAVAPAEARRQEERARTTVDFLVCLLAGHLLVALAGAAALGAGGNPWPPLAALVLLPVVAYGWYAVAVRATDDWAAAGRALVNLGRKPLAAELGLALPATIDAERALWTEVSRLALRPYDEGHPERLDRWRASGCDHSTGDPP